MKEKHLNYLTALLGSTLSTTTYAVALGLALQMTVAEIAKVWLLGSMSFFAIPFIMLTDFFSLPNIVFGFAIIVWINNIYIHHVMRE